MPTLFAYLVAVCVLLSGGYGAINWLSQPDPVKVVAKAHPKSKQSPSYQTEYEVSSSALDDSASRPLAFNLLNPSGVVTAEAGAQPDTEIAEPPQSEKNPANAKFQHDVARQPQQVVKPSARARSSGNQTDAISTSGHDREAVETVSFKASEQAT